jgi:5-methyltetrahydropteroyltriglutamate--homocysteine methyltransferase
MIPATHGHPPARADHIGSLLRPPRLRRAFRHFQEGKLGGEEFRAIQDDAIRDIVELQEEVGLDIVNDGEFRRGSYWGRFVELTEGLVVKPAAFTFHDEHGRELAFTAPYVSAKVRRGRPIAVDEVAFVRGLTRATTKVTLPSPSTLHFYRAAQYADPGVYETPREFFADLAAIYRQEIVALAAAGAEYVQLDEVALAMLCDPAVREKVAAQGQDPDSLVELYVEAINQAVADRPARLVVGVHVCRGNFKGLYLSEGGYDSVAEALFQRANVDHFLLEYDTVRAGGFAPLRFVPKGKGVVLGLISSKVAALEPLDLLKRRAAEAAKYIDGDRLALSPQCGFASTVGGNPMSEADMRGKLALVVSAARAIWG